MMRLHIKLRPVCSRPHRPALWTGGPCTERIEYPLCSAKLAAKPGVSSASCLLCETGSFTIAECGLHFTSQPSPTLCLFRLLGRLHLIIAVLESLTSVHMDL